MPIVATNSVADDVMCNRLRIRAEHRFTQGGAMLHKTAIKRAVKNAGLDKSDVHAPLVVLLLTLAGQMDAAGVDPSTRVSAAHLSALKDLERVRAPRPEFPTRTPQDDALKSFRAKIGINE